MKKISTLFSLTVTAVFLLASTAIASPTQVIDLGDQTVENVQTGYSNNVNLENLEYWFVKNGLTNEDGTAIDAVADQVQYELFYTDVTREYEVEFLGIGYASYHSPFGVFSYSADLTQTFDAASMTYGSPLFVQNEVAENTTYKFTVEAGNYFGFYLNPNNSGNNVSTLIASNKDGLDHAIFYNTNKGYTMAFEDIVGGGDRDYEDLVVNFSPTDGSGFANPTPEPASIFLLGLGLIGIAGVTRRKIGK